jgi:colanic acid/amylovoran biosynthesis glycosyltransferase
MDRNKHAMTLLVGTLRFPYGTGESFLTPEINGLAQAVPLKIIALHHRGEEVSHGKQAESLTSKVAPLNRSHSTSGARAVAQFLPSTARSVLASPSRRTVRSALAHGLVPEIRRVMEAGSVSHLHGYWASLPASLMMAAAGTGLPWSFTAHRGDVVLGWDLARKVRRASFVRCISDRTRTLLLDRVGDTDANRQKIHVIALPVDVPANPVTVETLTKAQRILTTGSLLPVKGHQHLIAAIGLLRQQGHEQAVTFAGNGPLRAELERAAQDVGVSDLIEFAGHVPHEELLQSLASGAYRAMVLPSVDLGDGNHEGVPVAMLEAMAAGVPTIATNTGGIPEALSGAGIVVPGANPQALAEAILAIRDDTTALSTARAVRARAVSNYSVNSVLNQLTSLMNISHVGLRPEKGTLA